MENPRHFFIAVYIVSLTVMRSENDYNKEVQCFEINSDAFRVDIHVSTDDLG